MIIDGVLESLDPGLKNTGFVLKGCNSFDMVLEGLHLCLKLLEVSCGLLRVVSEGANDLLLVRC